MSGRSAHNWWAKPGSLASLAPLLLVLAAPAVAAASFVATGGTRIEAAGEEGRWTGARIASGGRQVTVVQFTSEARWTASRVTSQAGKRSVSLTFRGFDTAETGGTPSLAPSSFVRFTLARGGRFPRVDFRFEMTSFDEAAWQDAWSGAWPLHFLCGAGVEPEYYYYGGWLAQIDADQTGSARPDEAKSGFLASGWSDLAAIGSLPIPAAGLWRPSERLVAYSFQHARSTGKSCRDIVIGHHRGADADGRDSVALLWPGGSSPGEVEYPGAPADLESHFDLLYDTGPDVTREPSDVVLKHTWTHYRSLLPTVPRMNDLGWMVDRYGLPEVMGGQGPANSLSDAPVEASELPGAMDPALVWRHAAMFIDDPDKRGTFDPAFLVLPFGAQPRTDRVDWEALGDLIRFMILAYVQTGDPRLKYCVRGALERWPGGFASDGYHMVQPISVPAPWSGGKECLPREGPLDSFWEWAQPAGDAVLHVTAGRKAAIAFCRGTTGLDVSDYRFQPPESFAFTVEGEHDGPFAMILSSPDVGLAEATVRVDGVEYGGQAVERSRHHLRFMGHAGATVKVGEPGDAELEEPAPVPTHARSIAGLEGIPEGLQCLDLTREFNAELDLSWQNRDSWAGLPAGRAFAHGVPYALSAPTEGKVAARGALVPVNRRAVGVFLICSKLTRKDLVVVQASGPLPPIDPEAGLPIRTGRPLRSWELWLYPLAISDGGEVDSIYVPSTADLFAITIERKGGNLVRHLKRLVESRREEERTTREAERVCEEMVLGCQRRMRRQLDRKIIRAALLPPHGSETIKLTEALHKLRIRATALRPSEITQPELLAANVYPIIVVPWPDGLLDSAQEHGAVEAAVLRYVQQGGTLVALGTRRASREDEAVRQFGRQVGLDLLAPGKRRDDSAGLSTVPEGKLILRRENGQDFVADLPDEIPMPGLRERGFTPVVGDRLPRDDEFIPLLTLYDRDQERQGAAMGAVKRRIPEVAGAKIIWVWGGLVSDEFPHADTVRFQAMTAAAELCRTGARGAPPGKPDARAVGVLPLADSRRADLVKSACADLDLGWADVREDAFVEPLVFNPSRFPIAVHAAPEGTFLQSWRLPHDGTDAYLRYVRQGGFLVVCGDGPPFRCPVEYVEDEWRGGEVLRPPLASELPLPMQSEVPPATGSLLLQAAPGEQLFRGAWKTVDLTPVGSRPWFCLARVRGADVEWRPLSYLADTDGRRREGYASAVVRLRETVGQTGAILYVCGELMDGARQKEFMRAALRCAMDEVQELPAE